MEIMYIEIHFNDCILFRLKEAHTSLSAWKVSKVLEVMTQLKRNQQRLTAYFSLLISSGSQGLYIRMLNSITECTFEASCLRAIAVAAAKLVEASIDLVLGSPLNLMFSYAVQTPLLIKIGWSLHKDNICVLEIAEW